MPSLAHYMAQYDHEHGSTSNKVLHAIGIPMIFAGIILFLFMKWVWGSGFFFGGGCFCFSDTRWKATIRHFSRDRFICSLGQSGSLEKFGCFSWEQTASRPQTVPREVPPQSSSAGFCNCLKTLREDGGLYERRWRQFCR